jgi:hypothetical protein
MMRTFLNKIDMYKKIPEDLYISSFSGSCMSIVGLLSMTILFILEFNAYISGTVQRDMVLDETLKHSDYLSAVFNITITDMPCVFVSVDVTDVTGTTRQNITKNINMLRVNHDGIALGQQAEHEVEPEEHEEVFGAEDEECVVARFCVPRLPVRRILLRARSILLHPRQPPHVRLARTHAHMHSLARLLT